MIISFTFYIETIVFELDNTLMFSTYKKHLMFGGYDASAYVKPI